MGRMTARQRYLFPPPEMGKAASLVRRSLILIQRWMVLSGELGGRAAGLARRQAPAATVHPKRSTLRATEMVEPAILIRGSGVEPMAATMDLAGLTVKSRLASIEAKKETDVCSSSADDATRTRSSA
eukprot:1241227-Amphidinium_carterae.2